MVGSWAITELYEAIMAHWESDAIEITDVKELADDLRKDGGPLGRQVAGKLQDSIDVECSTKNLCPSCFNELRHLTKQERLGDYWDAPYYELVTVGWECPECYYHKQD